MNGDFGYQKINTKDILVNPMAQRDVEARRTQFQRIMKAFDPAKVNPVKVAKINGRYYCFDGQMTMKVLKARNGGKDLPVQCAVYSNLTEPEMAQLFVDQNGIVSQVKLIDKVRVLKNYGDPEMVRFVRTTESNGLELSWTGTKAKNAILATSAALTVFRMFNNDEEYGRFIRVLKAAWDGEPSSLNGKIIRGLALFMKCYHEIDDERLAKKLAAARPVDIIRDAEADRSSGDRKYATQILQIYNKGLGNKFENKL